MNREDYFKGPCIFGDRGIVFSDFKVSNAYASLKGVIVNDKQKKFGQMFV